MNEIIINDDILLIDNFLDKDELHMIKYDIYSQKNEILLNNGNTHNHETTRYNRLYLNDKYNNINQSLSLTMINAKLFSLETMKIINKLDSFPFKTYFRFNHIETQITVYTEGGKYEWHIDNNDGRQMSYILPIQMTKEKMWSGGDLHIIVKGKDIIIKPKNNQLIIFSGHLRHMVTPVTMEDKTDILSGRVVINGHIGLLASKRCRK
jgi:Rps23 Pro-64 3,4-dihydroxylase Tpa1-like proline 4-hydroxylase|tara:strand:- start:1154 stop:1777 length:624 start_codon:yes stop_codon:yes gene_type:complete